MKIIIIQARRKTHMALCQALIVLCAAEVGGTRLGSRTRSTAVTAILATALSPVVSDLFSSQVNESDAEPGPTSILTDNKKIRGISLCFRL